MLTRDSEVSDQLVCSGSVQEIIDDVSRQIFSSNDRSDLIKCKGSIQSTTCLQGLVVPALARMSNK